MEFPTMNFFPFERKNKEKLFFKVPGVENLDIGYKELNK